MSGTIAGGQKASIKNRANEPDFYKRIGQIGGRNGHGYGFASPILCDCNYMLDSHKKSQCAGSKGGLISKRKIIMKKEK